MGVNKEVPAFFMKENKGDGNFVFTTSEIRYTVFSLTVNLPGI